MAEPLAAPPFIRLGPDLPATPVILSVPHAGRAYAPALLAAARLPREKLETLEDRLVDKLICRAVANGASALVATAPRAEIDLNRDEREIDPAMVVPTLPARSLLQSARTRGGLGLVPSRITGLGSIWLQRLTGAELSRRILAIHRPYHAALAQMLADARDRFGIAILLDCHSMPPRAAGAAVGADIVLGDRHGTSIGSDLLSAAVEAVEASGYTIARNLPYAGGYITAHHGRPAQGIHAVQMEIDRSRYLDAALRQPGAGFERAAEMLARLVDALSDKALEPSHALAAE